MGSSTRTIREDWGLQAPSPGAPATWLRSASPLCSSLGPHMGTTRLIFIRGAVWPRTLSAQLLVSRGSRPPLDLRSCTLGFLANVVVLNKFPLWSRGDLPGH